MFGEHAFENVTISDLAEEAGVSRSTYLRHFASKEEAVLYSLDALGDAVGCEMRARPSDEPVWHSARAALAPLVEHYLRDRDLSLALAQLIESSTTLSAARLVKQARWRTVLAEATRDKLGSSPDVDVVADVVAAAALSALDIATQLWLSSSGSVDFDNALDSIFDLARPQTTM